MTLSSRREINGCQVPSLNDEIAEAGSEAEINRLLQKGEGFEHVANRTKNRWQRTAKHRRAELRNSKPEPPKPREFIIHNKPVETMRAEEVKSGMNQTCGYCKPIHVREVLP